MARKTNPQPTDGELELLRILWEEGPSGLNAIWRRLNERRDVANTTVATMLKIMLDKRLVSRRKGPKGYVWSARHSREKTSQGLVQKLIHSAFDGSATRLVAHLLKDPSVTAAELDQLEALLEEKRSRRLKEESS